MKYVFRFGTKDIGIDLETANINVFVEGKGNVLRDPSTVARDISSSDIVAVGEDARNMIGRTPGLIITIRPMKNGVIAD